ncbi:MAG TPA: pitrilysin family protein [Bryobacteraceae bacterium]|nr:pitrilysin family protein [Bryobacteraceae bacterium]
MRTLVAHAAALLLLFPALLAALDPKGVRTFTLANGMKVIVEEDHDIPNVAMYLFYQVGSRNERPGITGISHFFEHMMFNGAKKYGPKQFDVEMEKAGGSNNAYTARDVTVYTDWFPRTALRLMFDMEADRIQYLSFDPKIIESERGVVASERLTRTDNNNFGLIYEQLNAAAYTAHPYGWPVVGWPSDIQAWSMEDLKAHFKMGYAPNNCLMVVVGDVSFDEVQKLAKEFMEPIPRQQPPPAVRTVEPPQLGERRVSVVKRSELPYQLVSWHVPKASHADIPALQVLSAVLSEGRSSRLYSRMVDREQLALSASAEVEQQLDPGQFLAYVRPRAGVDTAKTEKVLFEEIERVRTAEIRADELRKAKNQLLTQFYRQMKTISGRANQLGTAEIFLGSYEQMYGTPSRFEAVTAADVLRVAKQYLGPNQRTVATLIPEAAK